MACFYSKLVHSLLFLTQIIFNLLRPFSKVFAGASKEVRDQRIKKISFKGWCTTDCRALAERCYQLLPAFWACRGSNPAAPPAFTALRGKACQSFISW